MSQQDEQQKLRNLLRFVSDAPEDESIIKMDCNDHCEDMAALAERVVNGAPLSEILPELEEFMQYWQDCREEFMALVAVLRAELGPELPGPADETPGQT